MVAQLSCGDDTSPPSCVGCGTEIPPSRNSGNPRRYCSDACRKKAGRIAAAAQAQTAPLHPPAPTGPKAGGRGKAAENQGDQEQNTSVSEMPDTGSSRYYAKFASAPGQDVFSERKIVRGRLLHLLRQVTTIDRCKLCGWTPLGQSVVLKVGSRDGRNTAGFGGLERCGRIWLCPECAAKIRLRRGEEIAEGIARHLDNDGGAYFWTVAIPHEHGDRLKVVLGVLLELLRNLKRGRAYQTKKKRFGILGDIKAIEITHGQNGWHPHAHILVVTERRLSWDEWTSWAASLDTQVADGLRKLGWNPGRAGIRSTMIPVDKGHGLAKYLTKVQEKGLSNEMARADLKGGRKGGRTPFDILSDFGEHALADDLDLWHEYEKATKGRSAIRWSRGLRALLLPDQEAQTDEEIAAEDEGSEIAAHITFPVWREIRRDPDIRLECEFAAAEEGWEGLLRVLIRHRIDANGVYTPEEWATAGAVELELV